MKTQERIRDAIAQFPRLLMTTGLNISGLVLLDLATANGFGGEVVFVDTGYHFSETLQLLAKLTRRYREVTFVKLAGASASDDLYKADPELCCAINKVAPLHAYLSARKPDAILNARTRQSASTRGSLLAIEAGNPVKVNPLLEWTQEDLELYAKVYRLDLHPLYGEGFLSMGCWPCTSAVSPGADARSGRFVGQARTECGIWSNPKIGGGEPDSQDRIPLSRLAKGNL